jgi:hypothetical protein
MPVTINAQATNGLITTADGSGIVKLQSDGKTTNSLAWASYAYVGAATIVSSRSTYNLSSMTRNGAGDYTFGISVATSDSNYASLITPNYAGSVQTMNGSPGTRTSSQIRMIIGFNSGTSGGQTLYDFGIDFVLFGN